MSNQERGIIGNFNFMLTGLANAIGSGTQAIGNIAKVAETLAGTGVYMAENNDELIRVEGDAKHAMALRVAKENKAKMDIEFAKMYPKAK